MWRAKAVTWFESRYAVEEEGHPIATVKLGSWSETGAIAFGDEYMPVEREGFWSRRFILDGRKVRIVARSTGIFRRGFVLDHANEEYVLDPASWMGGVFELEHRGRSLGEIRNESFLGRRFEIDLEPALAPELRLFAFWLFLLAKKRAATMAAT